MHSKDLLMGLDLGTSAVKAVLVDCRDGAILSRMVRPIAVRQLGADRFEIEPEPFVQTVLSTMSRLVRSLEDRNRIRAVSFAAASGNTVLLDEEHRPVRRAVSWLDRRSGDAAARMWPRLDAETVYRKAGWPWLGTFPLAHLAWIRSFEPEVWRKARYFAMLNDYLYFRLCGRLVTDPSKATTFYLQDQAGGRWNPELLAFLGIRERNLPAIEPSGTAVGTLKPAAAEAAGLSPDTRVVTGAFDHPCAARSVRVREEGELLISAGTSWVALAPIQDRRTCLENHMLVDPFLSPQGCWAGMLSLTAVAKRVDTTLREITGRAPDPYRHFDHLAIRSTPGAGGLKLDPWRQTEAEIRDAVHGKSHSAVARALMESCAFRMKHLIEMVQGALGREVRRIVMVGGPTRSPVWPQILADAIGRRITVPDTESCAGALGAAMLAGIGAGLFRDLEQASSRVKAHERLIRPAREASRTYRALYREYASAFGP